MKRFSISAIGAVAALHAAALGATVDFETVPVGTRWGSAFGNSPGDVVLTQDDIDMSVEEFILGQFVGFNRAEIGGQFDDFFPTTPLELDNISARFHFDALAFPVDLVTLEYQEFGTGSQNLSANGGALFNVESLIGVPTEIAPGIVANVGTDSIELTGGPINFFTIGGQELAIDNVTAVPEPATLLLLGIGGTAVLARRRQPLRSARR